MMARWDSATLWWVTTALSLLVLARWPVGPSVLIATVAVAAGTVAVALAAPYLTVAFIVWLASGSDNARHLFAVAGVVVSLRVALVGLRRRR